MCYVWLCMVVFIMHDYFSWFMFYVDNCYLFDVK